MGNIVFHKKIKLFIGFIYRDEDALKKASAIIKKRWGEWDTESEAIEFCDTDYYQRELGDGLKKKFISIKKLVSPEKAHTLKIVTQRIEKILSKKGKRLINIDPGYITESKLILLTTKDHGHRIYLGRGIYAEITLRFHNKTFTPIETTYPDYKKEKYIRFFNETRRIYRENLAHV